MEIKKWLAAGLVLFMALPGYAECGGDDVKACLAQDLRDSDKRINAAYQSLMSNLDQAGKTSLRDEQRAWLKTRDKACGLDTRESDREKWLQGILADQDKTVCVVRYTFQRVSQFDAMIGKQDQAKPAELPPAPKAPDLTVARAPGAPTLASLTYFDDGYAIRSMASYTSGKWYYEALIDRDGIAALGDVLLSTGFRTNEVGVTHMDSIRRKMVGAGPLLIGMAIDLDQGFVYVRVNGAWQSQPGQVSPLQVKLGRPYWVSLNGSSEIREFINRGLVKINLGHEPFRYALPDGYKPFSNS
jgi:uncharacterized protein YecT (DUF1311 family)